MPKIDTSGRAITSMRLPVDLMDKLSALAKKEDRPRTYIVERILREAVEKQKVSGGSIFC